MNTQQAFAAYEAVRHRLPPVQRSGQRIKAENLDEIAQHFDAFFLDAFGVLNIGETAIPGSPERVLGLQEQGKRVLVVSNAASLNRSDLCKKYARLGYDFAPEDVVTSREATLSVAAILICQLDDIVGQPVFVDTSLRSFALCGSMLPKCAAGPALGNAKLLPHTVDAFATTRRA